MPRGPASAPSNLRQITIAADLYASDHADHMPPGAADFLSNLQRWHGSRSSASAAFTAEGGPITPYLDDSAEASKAIRACPTFAPTLRLLEQAGSAAGYERSCGGYGYNLRYVGVVLRRVTPSILTVATDRAGAARHVFQRPAATLGFRRLRRGDAGRHRCDRVLVHRAAILARCAHIAGGCVDALPAWCFRRAAWDGERGVARWACIGRVDVVYLSDGIRRARLPRPLARVDRSRRYERSVLWRVTTMASTEPNGEMPVDRCVCFGLPLEYLHGSPKPGDSRLRSSVRRRDAPPAARCAGRMCG